MSGRCRARRGRRSNELDSEVSIGDAVEAIFYLKPMPDEFESIRRILGFSATFAAVPAPTIGAPEPAPRVPTGPRQPDEPAGEAPETSQTLVTTSQPIPVDESRKEKPAWFADTKALPAPTTTPPDASVLPLLEPRWSRAILSGALSTRVDEGALDLPRVVDHIARARPFLRLPRWSIPTTRRGVEMLVDSGEGMLPYRADVAELTARIASVIGRHRAREHRFVRTPLAEPRDPDREAPEPFVFPRAGTPLVLLTDFGSVATGAVDRATTGEWLDFAEQARVARTPLVAFVPSAVTRVPLAIRRAVTVIAWDRTTSIKDVHRALRRPVLTVG